ncbi:hypothetical protein F5Y05DRAFT_146476 [Hypoxylon sp. FL0543]|nr:hypothetical protein F5Y05DRAFT_146476 [Hypoxylon sp. FL0543]
MVGIPKSNRCDFCRRRKTKCDEDWPTCGACKKAGKECSGPSKRVKFVNNGKHRGVGDHLGDLTRDSLDTNLTDETSSNTDSTGSLLNIKNRTMANGATFSKLRIYNRKPQIPSNPPGTEADLLGARVITCLKSGEGTGYSISMFLTTLVYVPPLLERNEALFDATSLLLSTWQKLCQGISPHELFDLRSYNRALRSLQKVLNDPDEQISHSTLAATIYLQMTEYLFDYARGVNQISHSNGIHSILMQKGVPKPGDNFGCQLLLDSFGFMFRLLLTGGIENFYIQPEWNHTLTSFFAQFKTRTPIVVEMSKLLTHATVVADVTRRMSQIWESPSYIPDAQETQELSATIDELSANFRALNDITIEPLLESKMIYEVADPESPFGTSYKFPNGITALHFANVYTFNIVVNRLRQELNKMQGISDPMLEAECYDWSSRIWRTCRYSQSLRPLCAVAFNSSLCVSYTAAGPVEQEFLLASLRESDGYKKSSESRWTDEIIRSKLWVLMGR